MNGFYHEEAFYPPPPPPFTPCSHVFVLTHMNHHRVKFFSVIRLVHWRYTDKYINKKYSYSSFSVQSQALRTNRSGAHQSHNRSSISWTFDFYRENDQLWPTRDSDLVVTWGLRPFQNKEVPTDVNMITHIAHRACVACSKMRYVRILEHATHARCECRVRNVLSV